eukprot:scaffold15.g4202.t1
MSRIGSDRLGVVEATPLPPQSQRGRRRWWVVQVAVATGLKHLNIGDLVKAQELHSGWDDEYECWVIDEDKVCDALEDALAAGGCIVDYHGCDFFPERWFDLVVVLQTDNTELWGRLERRGYAAAKIRGNVECEIMHAIVEEARESYRHAGLPLCASRGVAALEGGAWGGRWPRLLNRRCWPPPPSCRREEIVHVVQSTTPEDMETNVDNLCAWVRTWQPPVS